MMCNLCFQPRFILSCGGHECELLGEPTNALPGRNEYLALPQITLRGQFKGLSGMKQQLAQTTGFYSPL
jgi:hypothetical protein